MNSRQLAYDIIKNVIIYGQYANLALKQNLQLGKERDQPLITNIVYGTLQNQIYCRNQWLKHVDRKIDESVAVLLDMSTYQLLFLDKVPDYAVVSEAVDICRHIDSGRASGLVNAVLRKVIIEGRTELVGKDDLASFALNASMPEWIIRLWSKQYSEELAKEAARSMLVESKTAGRINTLKTSMEEVLQDPAMHPSRISTFGVIYEGNLVATPWFTDGKIVLQDEASQLVSELLDAQSGEDILDICAAPGTKTASVAEAMNNIGSIVACEVHPQRTELIERLMDKLGVSIVDTVTVDSRDLSEVLRPERRFDRILADVPCSGLGVLRRKPDIKIRIKPSNLDELINLQKDLLNEAANWLKVGGILVYSTCTINKKENERQIEIFLSEHEGFTLVSERTIWPQDVGTDGFYMAKLQRNN